MAARVRLATVHRCPHVNVTLPFDPSLVGRTGYAQGFVIDRTANALGAAISNAVEATFGQRW